MKFTGLDIDTSILSIAETSKHKVLTLVAHVGIGQCKTFVPVEYFTGNRPRPVFARNSFQVSLFLATSRHERASFWKLPCGLTGDT